VAQRVNDIEQSPKIFKKFVAFLHATEESAIEEEVAVGICSPSAMPRDFPAVTLPAIIGVVLTLWASNHSRAERAASA
jgi:hypothetical protein